MSNVTAEKIYTYDPEEHGVPVLGALCWYSFSDDAAMDYETLVKLITDADAALGLPRMPQAGDIFRRACTAAEEIKVPSHRSGRYFNYMIRNAGLDSTTIHRVVVEEEVDAKDHKLGFQEIGTLVFGKESGKINPLSNGMNSPEQFASFNRIHQKVEDYMTDNASIITSYILRETLRKGILGIGGSRVHPGGGVYFVGNSRKTEVMAIASVVDQIPNGFFHHLPLIDDAKQRAMVREAFQAESIGEAHKLMAKMSEISSKKGKNIPAKKLAELMRNFTDLQTKVNEYQEILGSELDRATSSLELCQRQIIEIANA
jgi:hypothetical protein